MTAPQPGLDHEPPPLRRRSSRDPFERNPGASEMSWGPGLVPKHLNGRPPSEGGIYMTKAPPVDESGKQIPRHPRQARGHPGEQVR
jgi:hypothetical protein